jgi:antirestriction protein ArdC
MKGASGNVIIYWDVKEYVNGNEVDKDKSIRRIPFLQKSYVFNISQTDLFRPAEENPVIPSCEEIISGMKVKPVIKNNTLRCCYNVKEDFISIPPINEFDSPAEYYSSLMHELVHMSGHPSRLNRFSQEFGDDKYSSEELVAELGSAYLCALTGISSKVLENQAAYIQSWLGQLNNDPMYFINAAVAAQKAVNYILGNSEPAQSSMN